MGIISTMRQTISYKHVKCMLYTIEHMILLYSFRGKNPRAFIFLYAYSKGVCMAVIQTNAAINYSIDEQ